MNECKLNKCCGSKQKLIETAAELIKCKGYELIGINEILEKARVTRSNFYYHFKSKEQLFLAAVDSIADYYMESIGTALSDQTVSPKQRLINFSNGLTEKMDDCCCDQGCPFMNLGNETCDAYPSFRQKIAEIYEQMMAIYAECYQQGIDAGEFRQDIAPEAFAKSFHATLNGSILASRILKDPAFIKENFKTLLAFISI